MNEAVIATQVVEAPTAEKPSEKKLTDLEQMDAALVAVSKRRKEKIKPEETPVQPITEPEPTTVIKTDEPQNKVDGEKKTEDAPKATKKFWKKEKVEPVVSHETKTENKFQLPKEIQDELDFYRKDESVQLITAGKKKGKSIFEITDEVRGTDPDKIDILDLFKIKLEKLGITDPEEVKDEIDNFESKPKSERLEAVSSAKQALKAERDEKLKRYSSDINQEVSAAEQAAKLQAENSQKAVQRTRAEYDPFADTMTGKELYGIKITPEITNRMKQVINEQQLETNEDGSTKPESLYNALFLNTHFELIADNIYNLAVAETEESHFKEETRPSSSGTPTRTPVQGGSNRDKRMAALIESLPNGKTK